MMRFLIHILFSVIAINLSGQVNVLVAWEKDSVLLGEELTLQLSVMTANDVIVESVDQNFLDSIISGFQTAQMRQMDSTKIQDFAYADVDVMDLGGFSNEDGNDIFSSDELNWERSTLNQQTLLTNKFTLQVWDPGQIIALAPDVSFQIGGQSYNQPGANQASLFVIPPISSEELSQDSLSIVPIRNIIKEPLKLSDFLIYAYVLGGLALLGLGYVLYARQIKKREEIVEEAEEVYIPPHRIALDKLIDLDAKKLWQKGSIKQYQSELTFIIREYIENRYKVPALELTTFETLQHLKKKNLDSFLSNELQNILQVADLVKFAKSKPDVNVHQEFMDKSVEFVKRTQGSNEKEEE